MSDSSTVNWKEEANESFSEVSEDTHEDKVSTYKGKYSAERLMMMLDKERLEALEEEFNEHPDGIELHNFIWLMKCAIVVEPEERADLILGLYYLFQDIDINGDEHMEWSEFTQYIIDAVMSGQGKEKEEEKDITPAEIMEQALTHKSRRYHLSKIVDRSFHEGNIKHIYFHPSLDLVSVIEAGNDSVKFFNTSSEIKLVLTPKYRSLGFVLSMAYSEKDYLLVIAGSDRRFYLYEKEPSSFRPTVTYQTNYISLILWYFELHSLWVSACEDFAFRLWNMKTGEEIFCFKGHDQTILDAVEIKHPRSLATASMDGNIIIWDVSEHKTLGFLSGRHERGVRSIDYCSDYGGNIVSVGYERDINLWSPEVTLSKCYAGKLEGHNCPVVACKFFKGRPACISVDEKGNVRVWDIRYRTCLQIIPHERGKTEVSKLVTLNKYDKFIVAGRRLVWFDMHEDSGNKGYKEVNPIHIEFNSYFFQLFVLTKYDLRIYDCSTGRLRKIFTDIQDSRTESELSAMIMDFRNRILFIGDNSGSIRAYNCANGALIKKVSSDTKDNIIEFEPEMVKKEEEKKQKDLNSEISAFHFCNEDKILIASSWDSTIMVYDLGDIEEVLLLRMMKGGHEGSDITCITYSTYMSMIASGSSNGIVCIWDFELGKLQGACFGHKREITSIAFLDPYPNLITFSLDGLICLWYFKALGTKSRLKCLTRLKNFSWSGISDDLTSVTVSLNLITSSAIHKKRRKRFVKQKKSDLKNKDKSLNFFKTREGEANSGSESEGAYEWVEETNFGQADEQNEDWGNQRSYLYVGDSQGYLKVWSFESFFRKHRIFPLTERIKDKVSYNPHRKDIKNAESDIKYWRKEADTEEFPPFVSTESEILIKEWKAHSDTINCIRPIDEPSALLSSSIDKLIKLWSRDGELWGKINLTSPEIPKSWKFPYDWEAKRQSDIKKVMDVLSLIEDNTDINPTFLSEQKKIQVKKKNKQKVEKTKEKKIEPTRQPIIIQPAFDFEDFDDEEEVNEKPVAVLKKNYASVADLQKRLDEMDELRNTEYEETRYQLAKKSTKGKGVMVLDDRKVEVKKSGNQRLPKIGSVKIRQKSGFDDNTGFMNRTFGRADGSIAKTKGEGLRPVVGMVSTGMINVGTCKLGNKRFRIRKEGNLDVRYKPGESIRVMNRAISSHSILQCAVLSPYTEDLKTLKKKNEIIKGLVQKHAGKLGTNNWSRKML